MSFEERNDAVAVDMLRKYAEVQKEWVKGGSEQVRDAMDKMVRKCGGLSVALGVAGKGIRGIARRRGGDGVGEKEGRLDAIVKCSEKVERWLHAQTDLGKREHGGYSRPHAPLDTNL